MKQNLFIIGPVASGKNTLLDNLKKIYNLNVLDTGRLYRYLTLCILEKTNINPNYDKLYKNDEQEEKRVIQEIYNWNKTLEKSYSPPSINTSSLKPLFLQLTKLIVINRIHNK